MKRTLLLPLLLLFWYNVHSQNLSVGGKVGTILTPQNTTLSQTPSPGQGTSAGMFAMYQSRSSRLGLQVELNFLRWKGKSLQLQFPLLAKLGIGKKVHVYAGPHISSEQTDSDEKVSNLNQLNWGFTTGISFNIPLSSKTILLTDARVDQSMDSGSSSEVPSPQKQIRVPAKSISFSISLGIAHEFKRWRARRKQKKAKRKSKK